MNASVWTIGVKGRAPVAIDSLGITNLKRKLKNQSVDTVTFTVKQSGSAAPLWAYLTTICIYRQLATDPAPVQWFQGVLTKPQGEIVGNTESVSYEVSGPWWYFEHTVMQQEWLNYVPAGGAPTSYPKSRLILGEGIGGDRLTTGQQLCAVIAWVLQCAGQSPTAALNAATPFQVGNATGDTWPMNGVIPDATSALSVWGGSVPLGMEMPFSEVQDRVCAECVKQVMRWVPNTVTWFDYSTAIPTLRIEHWSAIREYYAVTIPIDCIKPTSLQCAPRWDIQVPAVIITYEQIGSTNGNQYTNILVDAWPLGAYWANPAGVEPGVPTGVGAATVTPPVGSVINTVKLSGTSATWQTENVVVQPLPPSSDDPGDVDAITAWFYLKAPELRHMPVENIQYVSGSYWTECPDATSPLGQHESGWDGVDTLPSELVSGSVTPWMLAQDNDLKVGRLNLHATFTYRGASDPLAVSQTDQQAAYVDKYFGPGAASSDTSYQKTVDISVQATNAHTNIYTKLQSITPGEPVPTGIAQTLYDNLNTLHYEGSLVLTEVEVSGEVRVGNALNIADENGVPLPDSPQWATMAACVQQIEETTATGETQIKFGPPSHLTPQDTVELLRANRTRYATTNISNRAGQPDNSNQVEGGGVKQHGGGGTAPAGMPWQGATGDKDDSKEQTWSVWWGADSDADFVNPDGYPTPSEQLKQLDLYVADPDHDSAPWLQLVCAGDTEDDQALSGLKFVQGGAGLDFRWTHLSSAATPTFTLFGSDSDPASGAFYKGLRLSMDGGDTPAMLLAVSLDDPTSDDQIYIDLSAGPQIGLENKESSGDSILLNIVDGTPAIVLACGTGESATLNIDDQTPMLDLKNSTGDTATLQIDDGTPELSLAAGTGETATLSIDSGTPALDLVDARGNSADLQSDSLTLSGEDGSSASLVTDSLTLEDADGNTACLAADSLTISGTDGTTSTLSPGDLDLGDDGTIEIGSDGSVTVGDSVLSNGDLDLGSDGSIELGSDATIDSGTITIPAGEFSGNVDVGSLDCSGDGTFESDVSVASNLDCATLSGCDDSVWDMVTDNVDDSIRTALDTLSATIDCDAMTVTFSYSY